LIAFVGFFLVVVGLIPFYLWKRLIRDPRWPGRVRKVGGWATVLLAVLIPATLVGTRTGHFQWLAWPGFLWLALMFYLFVTLVILEIPRLLIGWWIRTADRRATAGSAGPADGVNPSGAESQIPEVAGAQKAERGSADRATPSPATGPPSPAISTPSPAISTANPTISTPSPAASSDPAPADRPKKVSAAAGDHSSTPTSAGDTGANVSGPAAVAPADGGDSPAQRGIDRRLLLARGAAIFAGLTAAGITGYGVRTALGPPQLDRVQLPLAKLPRAMDGTRLAVVSDIHLGPLTGIDHATRIVELINSVDADVVCIVGDLVDGSVAELGRFAAPLAGIRSRLGAYFVTGNHEYYSGYQQWVAEVARLGVRPLRNERLELAGLDLAGVNDVGGAAFGDGPDLQRALGHRDTSRPVVLMAHQPVVAYDAAPYGVDLQVSGHTHGGQLAPFNLLVSLQQPVVSGLGRVDGVPVYVTNGAGFWGPPVRVGAPPQVTLIELRTP
jgi:predicted MPP superfamily phosphohydrolase